MKDKIWNIEYQGYQIRLINKVSFLSFKTSGLIEINGVIVGRTEDISFRPYSTIFTKYKFSTIEQEIEVRIGEKSSILSGAGYQIFLDGKQISGEKILSYPDPYTSIQQIQNGFPRYFISFGLLRYGLPIAIGLMIVDFSHPLILLIEKFIIHGLSGGLLISCYQWYSIRKMLQERSKAKKKLACKC